MEAIHGIDLAPASHARAGGVGVEQIADEAPKGFFAKIRSLFR